MASLQSFTNVIPTDRERLLPTSPLMYRESIANAPLFPSPNSDRADWFLLKEAWLHPRPRNRKNFSFSRPNERNTLLGEMFFDAEKSVAGRRTVHFQFSDEDQCNGQRDVISRVSNANTFPRNSMVYFNGIFKLETRNCLTLQCLVFNLTCLAWSVRFVV